MGHAAQAVSHSRQPRLSYAHQWIRQDKHLHGSRAVNVYLTNNKIPFSSARLEKKHSVVRNYHTWKSNLALVLIKRSGIQDALLVWDHFLHFIHYALVKVYRNLLLWDFTSYCSGMSIIWIRNACMGLSKSLVLELWLEKAYTNTSSLDYLSNLDNMLWWLSKIV